MPSNGSSKILWFLLTLASAVVFGLVSAWALDVGGRLTDLEKHNVALVIQQAEVNTKLDMLLAERGLVYRKPK